MTFSNSNTKKLRQDCWHFSICSKEVEFDNLFLQLILVLGSSWLLVLLIFAFNTDLVVELAHLAFCNFTSQFIENRPKGCFSWEGLLSSEVPLDKGVELLVIFQDPVNHNAPILHRMASVIWISLDWVGSMWSAGSHAPLRWDLRPYWLQPLLPIFTVIKLECETSAFYLFPVRDGLQTISLSNFSRNSHSIGILVRHRFEIASWSCLAIPSRATW